MGNSSSLLYFPFNNLINNNQIMEEKYFCEELQEILEKLHTKVENGVVLTFDEEDDSIWDW